jgi:hypothetical protein
MSWTDGQRREVESSFGHAPGSHTSSVGHDWDAFRSEAPRGDTTDAELPAWESAWVDLGGEG